MLLVFLTSCQLYLPAAYTPTASATLEPTATDTPQPTFTPVPSHTPQPSSTVTPSITPSPTLTNPAHSIPILEYHNPSFDMAAKVKMQPAWFEEQMAWLASAGYNTLTANELIAYVQGAQAMPAPAVVLTFDVGTPHYQEYEQIVIPTLKKYGFHAIFFVLTASWVVRDDCQHLQDTFCWQDFKRWADEGVISIGSHGVSHPDYAKISIEAINQDMQQSKALLEQYIGQPVVILAYPFDSSPEAAQPLAAQNGYLLGISGNHRPQLGAQPGDSARYALPRLYPYSYPGYYPLLYAYNESFADVMKKVSY